MEDFTSALVSLTDLIRQQAETANRREERLEALAASQAAAPALRAPTDGSAVDNTSATSATSANRPRLPAAATPAPRLSGGASLREFCTWKARLTGYNMLTGVNQLKQEEQRASLYTLVDDEWHRIIKYGLNITDATNLTDTIDAMEKHLRSQRNVILDRRDFYRRNQQPDEPFDDYLIALKEISEYCDFCQHCTEDRLRDRIITGLCDDAAVQILLSEKTLTLQKTVDICRARENAFANASALTSDRLHAVSAYRRNQRNSSPGASASRRAGTASPVRARDTTPERQCRFCGGAWHQQLAMCPARNHRCSICHKLNHFSSVCQSGQTQTPRSGQHRDRSQQPDRQLPPPRGRTPRREASPPPRGHLRHLHGLHVRGLSARRTPKVDIEVQHACGQAVIPWIPDSGAEVCAMSVHQARSIGITMNNLSSPPDRLFGAAGQELDCRGTFQCTLRLGAETASAVTVCVIPNITGALLSWDRCIELGILPPDFPKQISRVDTSQHLVDSGNIRSTNNSSASCVRKLSSSDQRSPSASQAGRPSLASFEPRRAKYPIWHEGQGEPSVEVKQQHLNMLKDAFAEVFDVNRPLREMFGGPMEIVLNDDAQPYAVTAARSIPFAWRDKAKEQLEKLLQDGIISEVTHPTEWCHPLVVVPKKPTEGSNEDTTDARICVDLTMLNKHVRRGAHPAPSCHDIITGIDKDSKFFSKFDAKNGYFQIPLADESKDLTTFITPWGRFRFERCVQGLSTSGDEFNRRGDTALAGIPKTCKVTDDILCHDNTYSSHLKHVITVLERCAAHNITLNPAKLQFAQPSVEYCGFDINTNGYTVDQRKLRAISEFPVPQNLTDLRSFMGLVNQLASFSPDTASAASPLRDLLRPQNHWCWTSVHQAAFEAVKATLVSPPVLAFFQPGLPTALHTDATRLHGLSYALLQLQDGNWRLIQCGSRFVSETESRYAVIELEMTAICWAVRKNHIFLAGLKEFEIVCDHRPLIPLLNQKSLAQVENPRLLRLREKLVPYHFKAVWKSGKTHCIADALSRAPVDNPTAEDQEAEADVHHHLRIVALTSAQEIDDAGSCHMPDLLIDDLRTAAGSDDEYQQLAGIILTGFPDQKADLPPSLRAYWQVKDSLSIDNGIILCGTRLLIPRGLRRDVLRRLHAGHQGIERTKRRARQSVYWPGINQQVHETVTACSACRKYLPSQQKEPLLSDPEPSRVFETMSADFFSHAGKSWLVVADRLSGWPIAASIDGEPTARVLVSHLREVFAVTGVPNRLKTDGGPQFTARHTRTFLQKWGVVHTISSPHYPQSNGHAEAAVKSVKRLVQKCSTSGRLDLEEFSHAMLELRNTPRENGQSPAEVLFGHPLRTMVPMHYSAFASRWRQAADECDERAHARHEAARERYDAASRPLPSLQIGSHVSVQDHETGFWDRSGIVVAVGRFRTYLVKFASGRLLWRNRRYLRPYRPLVPTTEDRGDPPATSHSTGSAASVPAKRVRFADRPAEPVPRRSGRQTRPPDRLQVDPSRLRSYL